MPKKLLPPPKLNNLSFSGTAGVSAGRTKNFYGDSRFSTLTPEARLTVNKDDSPFCTFFANFQDGKNGVDDFNYYGITFPIPMGN